MSRVFNCRISEDIAQLGVWGVLFWLKNGLGLSTGV